MTKFDKFTCEYAKEHTINETITMLYNHALYIDYCKFDKNVNSIKGDDKKLDHINALIKFLKLWGLNHEYCNDLRSVYFND